jgi:hypothetical protein
MARSIGCVKVSIAQQGSMQLFFEGDNKEIRDAIERIFLKTDRHFDVVSGPPFMLTTVLNAKTIEEQTHEAGAILQSIA